MMWSQLYDINENANKRTQEMICIAEDDLQMQTKKRFRVMKSMKNFNKQFKFGAIVIETNAAC